MNVLQIVTSFPRFLLIKISGRNFFTIAQNKFLTKLSEESNPARLIPMNLNPFSTFFFVQRYIFFSIIKNKFSINSTFRTKKINYEKLDRQKSTLINLAFCFSFFFFSCNNSLQVYRYFGLIQNHGGCTLNTVGSRDTM